MQKRGTRPAVCLAAAAAAALFALGAPVARSATPKCTLVGTARAEHLAGTPGRDVICGRGGNDTISGLGGDDRLLGGPGNDRVLGDSGRDVLEGGAGEDFLAGGLGRDSCYDSAATVMNSCQQRAHDHDASTGLAAQRGCCARAIEEMPDTQAPAYVWLWFNRRYIDTSAGDATIGISVEAWDDSGIGSVSLQIDGPSGSWRGVELEMVTNKRFEASIPVAASTPTGDYRITSLTIADQKGNGRTLTGSELTEAGMPEFEIYQGPDVEGPTLTGFSISPAEVDTSNAPGAVDFSISAADDLSGVQWAAAAIQLPSWEPGPLTLTGACASEIPPDEGTKHAGVWWHTYPLVEHAMPGRYQVSGLYLCDLAGNESHYTSEELEELGFPTEFLETGSGDTTPPEILNVWLEPATLHAAKGDATIYFYTHVRDNDTGFGEWPNEGNSDIRVNFEHPPVQEFGTTGRVPELISGTDLDGVWRQEVTLEGSAPIGKYRVDGISATDRAGNVGTLEGSALDAKGWNLDFENLP
jgi:hypothetical protein